MSDKPIKWLHPNALQYSDSGKHHYYRRIWIRFELKMDNYRFTRWFASHNVGNWSDDPEFDAIAEKLSKQDWKALSDQEQETFAGHHAKQIGVKTRQDGLMLEGWGWLSGEVGPRMITALSVDDDPSRDGKELKDRYKKEFTRARVTIRSAEKESPGTMMVWGESERQFSPYDEMTGDEDYLSIEFYMLPEKLKALAHEVAAQPVKSTITLNGSAFMFYDEVKEWMDEGNPSECVIVYDHINDAVLESISFEMNAATANGKPWKEDADEEWESIAENDDNEGGAASDTSTNLEPAAPFSLIPEAVVANLSGIKYALWMLAVAIVGAAILR